MNDSQREEMGWYILLVRFQDILMGLEYVVGRRGGDVWR